jgi:hypothetical protein
MKRTAIAGLFVGCLLLMQAHTQAYAQEKTTAAQEPARAAHPKSIQWETIENMRVLRVWELQGREAFPQVAVLRVPNADYIKFLQDPQAFKQFVNRHRIFSKHIIVAGPWTSLSSVEGADPDTWTLTLVHGKMSTMLVAAVPDLKTEP